MLKIIINIFLFLVVATIGFYILKYAINQSEKVECYKLQRQAQEFKNAGFYITQNQAEMCEANNIIINAKILNK